MNKVKRIIYLGLIDIVIVNFAFLLAFLIRFEGEFPGQYVESFLMLAGPFTAVWLICFFIFKLYQRLWGYASIGELTAIIAAVSVGTLSNAAVTYFVFIGTDIMLPRSIFILLWMLNIVLIGGSRLVWRVVRDQYVLGPKRNGGTPVLIVGAGDAGAMVAREITHHYANEFHLVGFVDDEPAKQGLKMMDVPVLGMREDIPELVEAYDVEQIILAVPSAPRKVVREIFEICQKTGVKVKTVPGMYDLIDGKVSVKQMRDVDVDDLLGREPVDIDLDEIAGYLQGRRILITGAGGSIGSELCRQAAKFDPELLVLLDNSENSVFEIQMELEHSYGIINKEVQVVDVKDKWAVERVFREYSPEVVFHAAAHKHVPLMENNPAEAVKNNVLGTINLAEAAAGVGVDVFIGISTDKAVNPTSVMGASKRVAEMIVQHYNNRCTTRFAAVRFGNVLASRGSVIPLFKQQISRNGPVTVTDPEMTRYFMTIPEAVQLVIQAGAMAEDGEIFVLDMGEPVKIVDLAETLIRLSGFEPYEDIDIVFTGIRPGEKLYEELLTDKEGMVTTRHERIYVSRLEWYDPKLLEPYISGLSKMEFPKNDDEAVEFLETLVHGYNKFNAAIKSQGQAR